MAEPAEVRAVEVAERASARLEALAGTLRRLGAAVAAPVGVVGVAGALCWYAGDGTGSAVLTLVLAGAAAACWLVPSWAAGRLAAVVGGLAGVLRSSPERAARLQDRVRDVLAAVPAPGGHTGARPRLRGVSLRQLLRLRRLRRLRDLAGELGLSDVAALTAAPGRIVLALVAAVALSALTTLVALAGVLSLVV
jgi:hypothetical protein